MPEFFLGVPRPLLRAVLVFVSRSLWLMFRDVFPLVRVSREISDSLFGNRKKYLLRRAYLKQSDRRRLHASLSWLTEPKSVCPNHFFFIWTCFFFFEVKSNNLQKKRDIFLGEHNRPFDTDLVWNSGRQKRNFAE